MKKHQTATLYACVGGSWHGKAFLLEEGRTEVRVPKMRTIGIASAGPVVAEDIDPQAGILGGVERYRLETLVQRMDGEHHRALVREGMSPMGAMQRIAIEYIRRSKDRERMFVTSSAGDGSASAWFNIAGTLSRCLVVTLDLAEWGIVPGKTYTFERANPEGEKVRWLGCVPMICPMTKTATFVMSEHDAQGAPLTFENPLAWPGDAEIAGVVAKLAATGKTLEGESVRDVINVFVHGRREAIKKARPAEAERAKPESENGAEEARHDQR